MATQWQLQQLLHRLHPCKSSCWGSPKPMTGSGLFVQNLGHKWPLVAPFCKRNDLFYAQETISVFVKIYKNSSKC